MGKQVSRSLNIVIAAFGLALVSALQLQPAHVQCVHAAPHNLSPDATPSRRGRETVYRLEQLSRSVGKQTIFVSDSVVKIQQPNASRVTIMRAPSWRVNIINSVSKTWYEAPANSAQGLLMQRVMLFEGSNHNKLKWVPVEYGMIAGLPAARYVDSQYAKGWKFQNRGFESIVEEMQINGFWAARDSVVSASAANALAQVHGLPQIGHIPLRFFHVSLRARIKSVITDTFSIGATKLSINNLDIPAGYKRSVNEFDDEKAGQGLLDELLQSSDSSRQKSNKHH